MMDLHKIMRYGISIQMVFIYSFIPRFLALDMGFKTDLREEKKNGNTSKRNGLCCVHVTRLNAKDILPNSI